ncbi:hypothetical protein [Endozoicomonas sp. SESOKO4]|uniref:hypothetical protein n=2 Tax=Endozoicomonas TaxID=305899 RepID=UPI002148E068|nr:hypothetical protein [Endozoicomonas sp. SESOKO4]
MVKVMKKYELLFLFCIGFINVSYAGPQITGGDCQHLYTPSDTFWYFTPENPYTAAGAQCALLKEYDVSCPVGKHNSCCLIIAGDKNIPDTDYYGGVSVLLSGRWLVYKDYSTKAELFRDVNKGELRKAYEKCMNES